ncbi:23S rRNA (guanosine(2251)-2'-O)-methyltransferase RlmB [Thiomonas sp.]|jgi:23S rRNA (guanosine2251-2'-O)-methyltransferase|uniref:23S rRNA (guanosine(2251)-2'-O)-methyltransferase RlmB n=1 Tax=Thiomonas sp. TaxID=2047785 RepID=UPI002605389E|nr:23S rRNA (guanosine(2251)-2'-O)-methyltransferase RlmB [Thiomonas sp.]
MKPLYGFHAVGARLRAAPASVHAVYVDAARRDARMQQFLRKAQAAGVQVSALPAERLTALAGTDRHQGVVAQVEDRPQAHDVHAVLDGVQGAPLVLALDGVTDPHNLGAILRTADAAGVHLVIAPKDRAVGINPTVARVASGAAETVPYVMVTNLVRSLGELQERGLWVMGTDESATDDVYAADWRQAAVLVMGAEGSGMRRLVRETCDQLLRIPMLGAVESLNVSVATGVCLYEAVRQRRG